MPSDALAGPPPASDHGEDAVRQVEVAPRFRLVSEDDQRKRKRSRTGLLESERLFRTMFERAAVGIAHVSPDGHWLRVNQHLCDILGYRCDEFTIRTWQDITYPDDRAAGLASVRRALAGEVDQLEMDKRYVRKDGSLLWAHLTMSLVRTPEGAPEYFIVMVQDISERKRLEQERARLLEQERAARVEAEATNAQLRAMQALTDTALSHLALDDLLREVLGRVLAVMGVDTVGISLLDEDGRTLTLRAARGLGEDDVGRARIPMGQGFVGRIVASKAPVIVDADALSAADFEFEGSSPILWEKTRSLAGVPLLVDDQGEDQLVGVVAVGSVAPRRFTEVDVHLLQRAADRIALAIGRARLYAAEQVARQQAAERAERLNTILETMADGVAVYDQNGRAIQPVNRAYRELFALGRAPAEYEVLPTFDRARLVHVGDAATGALLPFERTPVGRALRGETVTGPSAEIRVRAFDGRELEVNSSAAPLRDGDGRVAGAVLVLRDMTWRKQLEREREAALARAQASEAQATERAERLNTILETIADGVGVYDQNGRLIQTNRAGRELLAVDRAPGFDALPFADQNLLFDIRDAATGEPLPLERTAPVRALRGEVVSGPDAEWRMRALDGREVEVSASVVPLRNHEGHVVGAVSVVRDVTWRKQLERERAAARVQAEAARADQLAAREASRRMEAFLATAAHDLRTPLTATLGYLALAQRQVRRLASAVPEEYLDLAHRVEDARSRLEDAGKAGKRLTRLLTLLFDTAAIRADRLELHRAPCDLAALVREQVEALRVAAPGRVIHLHVLATGDPVPVEADADRIEQVVTNYVTNALKYSPPDRPVGISVTVHGDRAHVAVCDAGPGLPKQERARVWELFHRATGVVAQGGAPGELVGGSLGLGLYICKAIIEAHGGRVGIKSAVGRGSTFWFTLPLATAESAHHVM